MTPRERAERLLRRLCEHFDPPLQPEAFEERCHVGPLPVVLAGWSARERDGALFHGSAAAVGGDPGPRAAYELVERLSVRWAQRSSTLALGPPGRAPGWQCPQSISRGPGEREAFRASISNGVAVASEPGRAREAAFLELVERDRVLRSWYGGPAPRRLELDSRPFEGALDRLYALERYALESPGDPDPGVSVCVLVGFPLRDEDPLAIGLGAARDGRAALRHAERELLQRVGFLWGEALPDAAPRPRPDPGYHLDAYLWPGGHARLRRWLQGGHERVGAELAVRREGAPELRFVDLTPDPLIGALHVAKAWSPLRLPLAFGDYVAFDRFAAGPRERGALAPADFPPHPIA